jgi:hypothetical protein
VTDDRSQSFQFYEHMKRHQIARVDSTGRHSYLTGNGWITPPIGASSLSLRAWAPLEGDSVLIRQVTLSHFNPIEVNAPPRDRKDVGLRKSLQVSWVGRRVAPILGYGAPRSVDPDVQTRAQAALASEELSGTDRARLPSLIEQAKDGFEREERRIDGIQQRAVFFLGASGLTTSLVLTNSSLLFGQTALNPTWAKILSAILLGLAAVFVVGAGLRALQATTTTFDRVLPNTRWQVTRRADLEEGSSQLDHLAALLLAQQRADVIGSWKLECLKQARNLFLLGVPGVLSVTAIVLTVAIT